MTSGCPYFKKVKCDLICTTQSYCSGYASGKLRTPVLDEEINFCMQKENYKKCYTYRFNKDSQLNYNSKLSSYRFSS